MALDVERIAEELAQLTKAHVAASIAPLEARIAALEAGEKAGKPRVRVSAADWQRPLEGQA